MLCLVEFRLIRVFIVRIVLPATFTLLLFLAFLTHGLLTLTRGSTLTRFLKLFFVLFFGFPNGGQTFSGTAFVELLLSLGTGSRIIADNPPLLPESPEV